MSARRHSFKHNDAARLIRATAAAGQRIKAVTLENGKVRLEIDDPSCSDAAKANPLDRVLKDAQDQKRSA